MLRLIVVQGQQQFVNLALADHRPRLLAGAGKHGKCEGRQQRENRDDHQQLNQCESSRLHRLPL